MRSITRASFFPFPLLAGIVLIGAGHLTAAPAAKAPDFVTQVTVKADTITFHVTGKYAGVRMVVVGPEDWYRDVAAPANASPTLSATDRDVDGRVMTDGLYSVELTAAPRIPRKIRARLQAAHERGEKRTVRQALRKAGLALEPRTHHQSFTLRNGKFLDPDLPEPRPERKRDETPAATACRGCGLSAPVATLARLAPRARWTFDAALRGDILPVDRVFSENVIVRGSLCVGLDCADGESFGADTLRLKENNTRLDFRDTSTIGGFPTTDWRLIANAQTNGGGNFFSIQDSTNDRVPFTLEAKAPTNALYVDRQGDVGLGTAGAVMELQLADGDTPTIRLEQTHVSGFTPQTWDIGSNEANFFIRDATTLSRLPFRIQPGAPTNSLYVSSPGNVGVGTDSPLTDLHVVRGGPVLPALRLHWLGDPPSSNHWWDIWVDDTAIGFRDQDANLPFRVKTSAPDNSFFLEDNGNIGLGTTAPQARLQINGDNSSPMIRLLNSSTLTKWDVVVDTAGFQIQSNNGASTPLGITDGAPNGALVITPAAVGVAARLVAQDQLVANGAITANDDITVTGAHGLFLGGAAPANKVDYYETGTWAPVFSGSAGGTPTYAPNGQRGTYQRIGNWVTLQGRIQLTGLSGFAGTARITGLPFTPKSVANYIYTGSIGQYTGWTGTFAGPPMAFIDQTGANVKIQYSAFAVSGMTDISPGPNFSLAFTISYEI